MSTSDHKQICGISNFKFSQIIKLTRLAAEVESLQKDKERLRTNIQRAEEEANILFEENKLLEEQNKKLLELLKQERYPKSSAGRHSTGVANSASATSKGKRKASLMEGNAISQVIDFSEANSLGVGQPLSPVRQSTPDSRQTKKCVAFMSSVVIE